MGERRARWGYGYQDKVATERILDFLRNDLRASTSAFEGVRLADLDAGRVDDFVLIWKNTVEGNSIKWSESASALTWGNFIGESGLLRELADGWQRLQRRWSGRTATVRLHTNRPASNAEHHAQLVPSPSLAHFITTHWTSGPTADDSVAVARAWQKIEGHVGLSGPDLSQFVAECDLALGRPQPPTEESDSVDSRYYRRQFDELHKAIATWLTNYPGADIIDKDYLLAAIGLQSHRSGLIQRFPEPELPYEQNRVAAGTLRAIVDDTRGGYVAIIGAAGVGKSTLVQDVLVESEYPFVVRYYAYLPTMDGNRDRAEALTFYQDIVARLDRFDSTRQTVGVSDLTQGRDALRRHMRCAAERHRSTGRKTLLLIDGLDHVMREVGLQVPVLHELPAPTEIPDGFLIILSGQPHAFRSGTVAAAIASATARADRRLNMSGLGREEVHALLGRLDRLTTGQERDSLYAACRGNPLVLTYLLAVFEGPALLSVPQAIELAGSYSGHIEEYYRERLSVPLQGGATRRVLGLLCRAAPILPVAWLSTWPEKEQLEDIYQQVLAPFVREEQGMWVFIHNSLIAFLKSETRSRLPGSDSVADECELYSTLADRSKSHSCLDPVGRARVTYLMRSQRHTELLEQVSSDWLRSAMRGFLPYAHVRPIILKAHAAAAAAGAWGESLRLLLLDHELEQRATRMDAGSLAEALLKVGDPELALAQIRSGGRLLVDDHIALKFAGYLWQFALREDEPKLESAARALYLQARPVSAIFGGEEVTGRGSQETADAVEAWSAVATLFERPSVVAGEIGGLVFGAGEDEYGRDAKATKAGLMLSALDAALVAGWEIPECRALVDAVGDVGAPGAHFWALWELAEAGGAEGLGDAVGAAYAAAGESEERNLAYACFLEARGEEARALEIVERLQHIRVGEHRRRQGWKFSELDYSVTLRRLQEVLGVPEGPLPGVEDGREEACARVERTAREVGRYLAVVKRGDAVGDRIGLLRALLLFHNRPVKFDTVTQQTRFILHTSRWEMYEHVMELAREMGRAGVKTLRDVVGELVSGPSAPQFWPQQRRDFAEFFFREGVMTREQAVELALSSTADASEEDPRERQEACLKIGAFLRRVGEQRVLEEWKGRAAEVSVGGGSHKDYHMARVAEWLGQSDGEIHARGLAAVERFARAVEVGGGDGTGEAAARVLQLVLRVAPDRAWRLAIEQIDRDVLSVWQVLEALVVGGTGAGVDGELLSAVYGELLVLIAPGDTSDVAVSVLRRFPRGQRRGVARRLMAYVRTNSLPSCRSRVGRALEDAVRCDGLEPVVLTQGLARGSDDSGGESGLYRLAGGGLATVREMSERLSDRGMADEWNPNPDENAEFDWWSAIEEARVENEEHLDQLIGAFPARDYRKVEVLVRRGDVLLADGEPASARAVIERALEESRDGSWDSWLDGAKKRLAFAALKRVDHAEGVRRARKEFGRDLASGKVSPFSVAQMTEVFELLEVEWPGDAAMRAVDDYVEQVLAASAAVKQYASLSSEASGWSAERGLCRFVAELVVCPVVDVGGAARRVLAGYVGRGGRELAELVKDGSWWKVQQLEHLLAAVHVGAEEGTGDIAHMRTFVEGLNRAESIGVRGIAKRICQGQGWVWTEVTDAAASPVILLSRSSVGRRGAGTVVGGDTTEGWNLHQFLMRKLRRAGLEADELRSEFDSVYWTLEREYPWNSGERVQTWLGLLLTRFWLGTGTILGREAAMRVFGRHALAGRVGAGAEGAYDVFYPVYDARLEMQQPGERPPELRAMEWRLSGEEGAAWRRGEGGEDWGGYPDEVGGRRLIGERTWLVRPEWGWPREERYRGVTSGAGDVRDRGAVGTGVSLTYEMYLDGQGQETAQVVVLNDEGPLDGAACRWAALNANLARSLGWRAAGDVPFRWLDACGRVMVESVFWRDGWKWIQPAHFESLGEGWCVVASEAAVDAIREYAPGARIHLWVERRAYGDAPCDEGWHLRRLL